MNNQKYNHKSIFSWWYVLFLGAFVAAYFLYRDHGNQASSTLSTEDIKVEVNTSHLNDCVKVDNKTTKQTLLKPIQEVQEVKKDTINTVKEPYVSNENDLKRKHIDKIYREINFIPFDDIVYIVNSVNNNGTDCNTAIYFIFNRRNCNFRNGELRYNKLFTENDVSKFKELCADYKKHNDEKTIHDIADLICYKKGKYLALKIVHDKFQ